MHTARSLGSVASNVADSGVVAGDGADGLAVVVDAGDMVADSTAGTGGISGTGVDACVAGSGIGAGAALVQVLWPGCLPDSRLHWSLPLM